MACGCGNTTTVTVGNIEVQATTENHQVVQPLSQQGNTLPQWNGNKLVNHKAVKNVTGFHLMKSTK